ncbi:MAG: DUF262 domain-containing protein [Clostridium sp.]|nr:DUF262 domain-containing protein [Clostridium sp.]
MSDLLGIICPLNKLLSDKEESINIKVDGKKRNILTLNENRKYTIPDFQREIRWEKDNIAQLIDDIYTGPKYLGNIILTKDVEKDEYLIIDGQQRITVITMILSCLRYIHGNSIEVIKPCKLSIESFEGFERVLSNNFSNELKSQQDILNTDKLHQIDKYYELWRSIKVINYITNKKEATTFVENLCKSSVNIILNESDDTKDGIRYFIDVNLKGKQLDTEDIFKGYLFRNDASKEIRSVWYKLKTNIASLEEKRVKYPLLKSLEHYFYCDLYNDNKFQGLQFDESFLIKSEFVMKDGTDTKYRRMTHIIEVINDKNYMLNSLQKLNDAIELMINIVDNNSPSEKFKNLFKFPSGKIDNDELEIFHNFMKKILKDDKVLPKALLMKYILSVLIVEENEKKKKELKSIYSVYLLYVLFILFESKKNLEVFISVLKAPNDLWYGEAIKVINSYFEADKITDNKIIAQYNKGTNEEEEDYRFRCKSLATIYNFFKIENQQVSIRDIKKMKEFISNNELYTTEHFIISQSKTKQLLLNINNEEKIYQLNDKIYKQYVNNLFNFIFINGEENRKLKNSWLPDKLKLINKKNIECEYSKMVMNKLRKLNNLMKKIDSYEENYQDQLDLFFFKDFKEKYIEYSREVLDEVINKVKNMK